MKTNDIAPATLSLFEAINIAFRMEPGKELPTFEILPREGSTLRKDKPLLADLVKLELIKVRVDKKDDAKTYISLTPKGTELRDELEAAAMLGDDTPTTVVDGRKPGKPLVDAKPTGKITVSDIIAAGKSLVQERFEARQAGKAAATPAKPAAKPKINRAAVRYQAIQECMAAVKADGWRKSDYKPMLKQLQTNYPDLFNLGRKTTQELQTAYATGIVDFCLAACRKLDKKPA